jgi:zinc protease
MSAQTSRTTATRALALFGLAALSCRSGGLSNGQGAGGLVAQTGARAQGGSAASVRVLERRAESSPLVTIRVVFSSGSADDPESKHGLTYVLARTMAKGAAGGQSYEALTQRLFPMAASVGMNVDRERTAFYVTAHRDHVEALYPILRDIVLRPELREEDFTRNRTQTRSELVDELRGNDDEQLAKELLQSAIYQGHPYGHPPLGSERGLAALTVEDLRAHRARVFCQDRVIVGLAGAYPAGLAQRVREDFAALPARCPARAPLPTVRRPSGVRVLAVEKPSAAATAVSMGFSVPFGREDPRFFGVQFVTNYLGLHRQSSGVLYSTLREARGLNYGDYAYAEHFEQEGWSRFATPHLGRSQQYASIWLRPLRPATAHFAIRGALRALATTLDRGVDAESFSRTQTFLRGYVTLYAQTESARLGYALDGALLGWPDGEDYVRRASAGWSALTPATAMAAARETLTARDLWIAVVGPNARALAEALRTEAPSAITYDSPKPESVLSEDREINAYRVGVAQDGVRVLSLDEVFRD